jgi:hypothetical protein
MSPLRRHGGGRPRTAHSVLDLAERWGISEKAARRLASLNLSEETMALMVADSQRHAAVQRRESVTRGRYPGSLRSLGMRSRMPGDNCLPAGNCLPGLAAGRA